MIIKPIIASAMMGVVSYGVYILLNSILPTRISIAILFFNKYFWISGAKLATIIALFVAVIVYILSVFILRIFSEEDILMLPFGAKIYAILRKIGIYKQK